MKLTAPADLDKEQTLDLDKYLVCVMELLGPPYVAQIMLSYSLLLTKQTPLHWHWHGHWAVDRVML